MIKLINKMFSNSIQLIIFLACALFSLQSFGQGGPSSGGTGEPKDQTLDYLSRSVTHTYIGNGEIEIDIKRSLFCSVKDTGCEEKAFGHMMKTINSLCANDSGYLIQPVANRIDSVKSVTKSGTKVVSLQAFGNCADTKLSQNLKEKDSGKLLKTKDFSILVSKNSDPTATQVHLNLCNLSNRQACKAQAIMALERRAEFACRQVNPKFNSQQLDLRIYQLPKKYGRFEVVGVSESSCFDPQK